MPASQQKASSNTRASARAAPVEEAFALKESGASVERAPDAARTVRAASAAAPMGSGACGVPGALTAGLATFDAALGTPNVAR